MKPQQDLRSQFAAARHNVALVVLEGMHAVKHARRFGAEFELMATADRTRLVAMAHDLAPDIADFVAMQALEVSPELFRQLAPVPPASGVIAIARRPNYALADVMQGGRPTVVLHEPRRLGNVGAAIRVAAAAGAGGVVVVGGGDPWHAEAVRGAAGLHWALPVLHLADLPAEHPPLVAVDPDGAEMATASLPPHAWLLFGTERAGLSDELRARADLEVRIPMQPGVSSLNLATSVAVMLYGMGPAT